MPRDLRIAMPAGFAIFGASAVIAAWIIGQRSAADYGGGLDYMVEPLPISGTVFAVMGVVAIATYACALVYVRRNNEWEPSRSRSIRSIQLLTLAGIVFGGVYRIVTAGVIGANIGGGLVVWVGLPLCVFLVNRAFRPARSEEPESPVEPLSDAP